MVANLIRFEIGGREVSPGDLRDALMAATLESLRDQVASIVGSIRDPVTGEFPTVVVRGTDLENITLHVEGSERLVQIVEARLKSIFGASEVDDREETEMASPRAFLCYASEDRALANTIARTLIANGIEVWWDQWCITAGDSFRQKIDEGIAGCTHFLVLLTPKSIAKPWVNHELDAALILRLEGQCKLLPVRFGLDIVALPPLLRPLHSPEIESNDLAQLINDIHGISRLPPLGPAPRATQDRHMQAGYSAAAMAVARLFVERSTIGMFADPQLSAHEIATELNLTAEDLEDALHELSSHLREEWDCVVPENSFFSKFDHFWKFDTESDARILAADLVNDPEFPHRASDIAQRYGWDARRLNPTINWLLERGLIDDDPVIGSHPFCMMRVIKNGNTRRFVKSIDHR